MNPWKLIVEACCAAKWSKRPEPGVVARNTLHDFSGLAKFIGESLLPQLDPHLWPDMANAFRGLPKSHHVRLLHMQLLQSQRSCQTGAKCFPAWENSLGSFLLPWKFIVEACCAAKRSKRPKPGVVARNRLNDVFRPCKFHCGVSSSTARSTSVARHGKCFSWPSEKSSCTLSPHAAFPKPEVLPDRGQMIFPGLAKFIGGVRESLEIDRGSLLRIQITQAWSCCETQAT